MNLIDLLQFMLIDPWHYFGTICFIGFLYILFGASANQIIATYFTQKTTHVMKVAAANKQFAVPSSEIETRG